MSIMKLLSRKLAMPLLGMLLWVISIHAGTFAAATLLPHPLTGYGHDLKETSLRAKPLRILVKDLNHSVSFGQDVLKRMQRLETNLGWSQIFIKSGTPAHGQLIMSNADQEALEQGKDALIASKATTFLMNSFCSKHHLTRPECSKAISTFKLTSTPLEKSCKKYKKECSQEEILSSYRSLDGSCNHQYDGSRGAASTQYKRLLHPDYLDGVQQPRRSVKKNLLPSPRLISHLLAKKTSDNVNGATLLTMVWSHFVEHDLTHTVSRKMVHSKNTIECCNADGSNLSPRYLHPFCDAISVPYDDEHYMQYGLECMTYVRSVPALRADCAFGPLEQVNQASQLLDASQIYGSSLKKSLLLRTFKNGFLNTSRGNLPPLSSNPNEDCGNDQSCFAAGDSRVNFHPQLTAIHVVFLREHNRIASLLSEINSNWDDETLYQEARRIVVAEVQHITYNQWLLKILGDKYTQKIEKYSSYNERTDPSVSNSFATAAIRVVNSLMVDQLKLYSEERVENSSLHLRNHYHDSSILSKRGVLEGLIRGLATQSTQDMDSHFTDDVRNHLFSNGDYGYDVFSLDIARGRDHGLPPYVEYRTLCGLPKVKSFDELYDVMDYEMIETLSKVYSHVNDIDLIVGGISERADANSLFGPTLSCIIADQFLRTQRGDRYFYKNENQPAPFSRAQIREIEKTSLARIFCDNSDIKLIQVDVFRRIQTGNGLMTCEDLPQLNLKLWAADHGQYY